MVVFQCVMDGIRILEAIGGPLSPYKNIEIQD